MPKAVDVAQEPPLTPPPVPQSLAAAPISPAELILRQRVEAPARDEIVIPPVAPLIARADVVVVESPSTVVVAKYRLPPALRIVH